VFDKLRKLFAGKEAEAEKPARAGANRAPRPVVRRKVAARPGAGRPGEASGPVSVRERGALADPHLSAARSQRSASVPGPGLGGAPHLSDVAPVETACPSCGAPMLAGWGTTCGKCRPAFVAPKTLFFSANDVVLPAHAATGMTLGWLVVVRTDDQSQQGALLDLDRPIVVLSRTGAPPVGADKVVQFPDNFMSSGHAVLRSPQTGENTDPFTISDRANPSPSVNGTFVNSHRLDAGEILRLSDGDTIRVGNTELLFKSLWLPPPGRPT
jgi:hypothetical protein